MSVDTFSIRAPLLHEFIPLHARWYPNKTALIDEQQSLTWSELEVRSNQVANGLIASGIRKGESVAILMSNTVEYAEILYGILKAGAVAVPLNLSVNAAGIRNMLADAAVKVLFFDGQTETLARAANAESSLNDMLHWQHGGSDNNYSVWRNAQSASASPVDVAEDDIVNIIYSSGTTGSPKGIKHSARRRTQSMYELGMAHRYHFGAISICPIGLYSNIAWASLFCALIVGGTCVIQDGFTPEKWIAAVEQHGVTHTMGVPLQLQKIIDDPSFKPERVASMQAIVSGGSPLYAGLKNRLMEAMDCAIIELYGLTEGFMTTLQPEEAEGRLTSVGKPVRGHDYVIVSNDDRVMPWGEAGEICVRSVHWMVEYHNKTPETKDAMFFDERGTQWLRTGDIGKTDEDGYLYIVDRKKDMILSGGQNIYPADIEAIVIEHPAISEVSVIGIPHEKWGETPLALVVPTAERSDIDTDALKTWINERVGKRQRVHAVALVDGLPRNPNGKVLKRNLREQFRGYGV